jgi:hypothetical protein
MLSFLAKKDAKEVEVDLGLLLKESTFGVTHTRLIFAECKNNAEFEKSDVDKMKWVAEQFPGAIIVFATLNKQLSDKEQKLIRPFVNKGRKEWKAEMPYNPVLVLTATELLSDWGPPTCWRDAGEFYKPLRRAVRTLLERINPALRLNSTDVLGPQALE